MVKKKKLSDKDLKKTGGRGFFGRLEKDASGLIKDIKNPQAGAKAFNNWADDSSAFNPSKQHHWTPLRNVYDGIKWQDSGD